MDLWWSRRRSSCVWRVERCVLWRQLQIREPGWSLMESWWGSHGRSFTLGGMFLSTGLRKCILCRVLLDYYRPELNACTIYKLTPFLIFNLLLIKYNDDHEDLVMRITQPKLGAGFRSVPVYFVCLKQWWLSLLWSLFIIWWVPFLAVLCDWCEEMKPLSWCDIMCVLSFFFFFWLHHSAYEISGLLPGIEPGPQPWKHWVSTTGPPGNSLICSFFFHLRTHWIFTLVTFDQSGVGITALGSLLFKLCLSVRYEEKYKWVCRLIL